MHEYIKYLNNMLMHEHIDYFETIKRLIFFLEDPLGYVVNMTIVALFMVGLCNVVIAMIRMAREWLAVGRARAALHLPDSQCPAGPSEAVLRFLKVSSRSLLGRRVARVIRLRTAGIEHRDILQQLLGERLESYGALARYIGTILTLMGLLGTVFGLSLAVLKAQGALSAGYDLAALRDLAQALGGTLGGMKTAFVTTLTGLLTALPLSFCNHLVRRTQSYLLVHMEDLVICDLLPALEKAEPGANEAARVFAQVITAAATELQQLGETIATAATAYKSSSEETAQGVATFLSTVQSFDRSVAQMAENQQNFTQIMRETRDAVRTMNDTVIRQLDAALRAFSDMTLDVHGNMSPLFERLGVDNSRDREILRSTLQETLDKMFTEFKTSLPNLLANLTQQYQEGVISPLESLLARHMNDLRIALQAFSDMAIDVHDSMGTVFEQLAATGNGRVRSYSPWPGRGSDNEATFEKP
jgi:biopolymer transport protein ExbB/TolQ